MSEVRKPLPPNAGNVSASDIITYALLNTAILKAFINSPPKPVVVSVDHRKAPELKVTSGSDQQYPASSIPSAIAATCASPKAQSYYKFTQTLPLKVPLLDSPSLVNSFMSTVDTVLFDCDGVLYRDSSITPRAGEILTKLQSTMGKRVYFVTNTSTKSRQQMRDKLSKILNVPLSVEQMVPSSWACAMYFKRTHPTVKKVYLIGGQGLIDELSAVGISCVGGPAPTKLALFTETEIASFQGDSGVEAVVVGLATDFSYRMLCEAAFYLQNPAVLFVSTNMDAYDLIGKDARLQPANGAAVAAIQHVVGRKAVVVGKPSTHLYDSMRLHMGVEPERTLMIGDRMDTDVKFGMDHGMKTALTLSGCTTGELFSKHVPTMEEPLPTVVIPHIGLFLEDYFGDENATSKL